jgi:hypothetical protein
MSTQAEVRGQAVLLLHARGGALGGDYVGEMRACPDMAPYA